MFCSKHDLMIVEIYSLSHERTFTSPGPWALYSSVISDVVCSGCACASEYANNVLEDSNPTRARVASTPVDSLRKRERQIMAAAYDLAKKTSVKALIYFSPPPKSAVGHADADEPEDADDEAVVEEGGRAMPSSAKEPHRARREAGPATAPPIAGLQPNALLDPRMALMCTVRRARRRRRPREPSPRLLASIAPPSAPAQTAHQSALIPRLNS